MRQSGIRLCTFIPLSVSLFLVLFRTSAVPHHDLWFHDEFLRGSIPWTRLLSASDQIIIIPKLLIALLSKAGLWSFQYFLLIPIICLVITTWCVSEAMKNCGAPHAERQLITCLSSWVLLITVPLYFRHILLPIPFSYMWFGLVVLLLSPKQLSHSRALAATACCLCATISWATGVLTWPCAIILISTEKSSLAKKYLVAWSACFLLAVGIYGYGSATSTVSHRFEMANIILQSVALIGKTANPFLSIRYATVFGFLVLITSFLIGINILRQKSETTKGELMGAACMLFGILSVGLVAIGRSYDVAFSNQARYIVLTPIITVGLCVFLAHNRHTKPSAKCVCGALLLFQIAILPKQIHRWHTTDEQLVMAYSCAQIPDIAPDECIQKNVFRIRDFKKNYATYENMGLIERIDSKSIIFAEKESAKGKINDTYSEGGNLIVSGLVDTPQCSAEQQILLTDKRKKVLGYGRASYRRLNENFCRWKIMIRNPEPKSDPDSLKINIWAYDKKTKVAIPATG